MIDTLTVEKDGIAQYSDTVFIYLAFGYAASPKYLSLIILQ